MNFWDKVCSSNIYIFETNNLQFVHNSLKRHAHEKSVRGRAERTYGQKAPTITDARLSLALLRCDEARQALTHYQIPCTLAREYVCYVYDAYSTIKDLHSCVLIIALQYSS